MSVSDHPTSLVYSIAAAPSVEDVKTIAAITDPVLRNLQITECYCELSTAFAKRTGLMANWCTFATWASKQAGQTIRSDDLKKTLEALLKKEEGDEETLSLVVSLAKGLGAGQPLDQLRQSGIAVMLHDTANRAADAVSRGNKKVFEEIAFEFARFMTACLNDDAYAKENIDRFCASLHPGDAPVGQDLLQKAFDNYYQAFFETDAKKKTELCLLANLQIGFHEQTRLQPEITEALNAAISNTEEVRDQLLAMLFKNAGVLVKLRLFFQRIFGKTAMLDKAAEKLVMLMQKTLRTLLTVHLMTLTMPPDNRLQLGKDLLINYDDNLKILSYPALLQLLSQVDATPDSLKETGATDWAELKERMHFIADLFRCYHLRKEMFDKAFTEEQVKAIKEGRLPQGRL
jgi:hypothetical protein